MTIGASGHLLKNQVAHSNDFKELDRASEDAASRCYYRPATIDGRPVQGLLPVQYNWTLE